MNSLLELRYNDANDTIEIIYKGCQKLDDYIRYQVTPKSRVWSKASHCWVVTPDALGKVAAIGSTYFDEVKYFSLPPNLQTVVSGFLKSKSFTMEDKAPITESNYKKLYLIDDAPIEVVRGAYKALALRYHPDNQDTGDSEQFMEIAAAYKAIKD